MARPARTVLILKILALDTATTACSVAVRRDGETLASALEPMVRGQSEALMPMVLSVLSATGLGVADMDLIAVTRGPGAFTGLRIGLAAARGLALASDVACCGVTTTEAIAEAARQSASEDQILMVALDSKRSDIYIDVFDRSGALLDQPQAVALQDVPGLVEGLGVTGELCVVGDAADRVIGVMSGNVSKSSAAEYPDARYVAAVGERLLMAGGPLPETRPLYLRPADAVIPKNGGRLRP